MAFALYVGFQRQCVEFHENFHTNSNEKFANISPERKMTLLQEGKMVLDRSMSLRNSCSANMWSSLYSVVITPGWKKTVIYYEGKRASQLLSLFCYRLQMTVKIGSGRF